MIPDSTSQISRIPHSLIRGKHSVLVPCSVADPGEGPGGGGSRPLICRPNWGPKGRKIFFSRTTPLPPYQRVLMTPPPPTLISKSGSGTACLPKYWQADISKGSIWNLENIYFILKRNKKQTAIMNIRQYERIFGKKKDFKTFTEMRSYFLMFITAVCLLFLLKLRWPRNKSIFDIPLNLSVYKLLLFHPFCSSSFQKYARVLFDDFVTRNK